jgi:NAD(P)H-flavin reductase
VEKNNLAPEIFELSFESEENLTIKHWQFITFLLPALWWRAYSILETNQHIAKFIIKRIENGRWWSKFICDSEIWTILKWVWPAWHFVLKENDKNKLFLWTWTWFVPLYNQIIWAIKNNLKANLKLIFWVRTFKDLFYIAELEKIKSQNDNFDFEIYLSREDFSWCKRWYTTDYLTKENIENFEEYYICWMAEMIDSCVEKLKNLWINEENIFTEKY